MVEKAERKILDMVENGAITAEEGLRLINAMGVNKQEDQAQPPAPGDQSTTLLPEDILESSRPHISAAEQHRMNRLKRWWVLPFGLGLVITAMGAIWMYTGYANSGFGWGFWLAWIPFLLGVFVVAVSFQTSRSVWVHVRIKQKPGERPQRISISLPLPISLTQWFLSAFGNRIPGLKDQPLNNYSEILNDISPEEPFYVHVDDDGEEVEVFIG